MIMGSDSANTHANQAGAIGIGPLAKHSTTPTSGASVLPGVISGGAHGGTSLNDSSVKNSGPNDPEQMLKKWGGTEHNYWFGINACRSGAIPLPLGGRNSAKSSSALSSAP